NLYFTARMLFSLSRGGYAPVSLGKLSKRGMPVTAVLVSSVGTLVALGLSGVFKETAFVFLIGIGFFGGPFILLVTLARHFAVRRKVREQGKQFVRFAPPGPWSSLLGISGLVGVLASTWWMPDFHVTLLAGPPWIGFLTLCYFIWRAYQKRKPVDGT